MNITLAQQSNIGLVKNITLTTIQEIYPKYYPSGAVEFFLHHHSDAHIQKDIANNCVYLFYDKAHKAVGTVTIQQNEICRLFVLPEHQGNGYGRALLEFAELEIAKHYPAIILDASLSAKPIYLKRGYREIEYHTIQTEQGDFLCYDVMKKQL